MKALSIQQPFASLISIGLKKIELRSWRPTIEVGETFLVCSSATPNRDAISRFDELIELPTMPNGRALCLAQLVEVIDMTTATEEQLTDACFFDDHELLKGVWGWRLEVIPIENPFPVKGKLRFFEVEFSQ